MSGKTVIHTWALKMNHDGFVGFGDMVRGIATLYQVCAELGHTLIVDFSLHPVSAFLENPPHQYSDLVLQNKNSIEFFALYNFRELKQLLNKRLATTNVTFFSTNGFLDAWNISDECQAFLRKVLVPQKHFADFIEAHVFRPCHVFHIRFGDKLLVDNKTTDFSLFVDLLKANVVEGSVLLTDSSEFKKRVTGMVSTFDTHVIHLGICDDQSGVRDSLFEFFVASRADSITTFSTYLHVSGFMVAASQIFNVPLRCLRRSSLDFLKVHRSDKEKFRLGASGDGGYVCVDVAPYDLFLSCGVGDDVSFEIAFLDKYPGVTAFAFDGTVSGLPVPVPGLQYVKKNISFVESAETTTLAEYMEPCENIFLKMDIESYEFRWLQAMPENFLKKIKQIVIEVHFPFTSSDYAHFDRPLPVKDKMATLLKLSKTHTLIHVHANNCCGTSLYADHVVPNIFECTYVRKDLHRFCGYNRDPVPTPLDSPNVPGRPDIQLTEYPFVPLINN
jgi:hypothetical protein